MTIDRTAVPPRATALADRISPGARTQAPPADAFSALLGAAAPKADERPARREDPRRWDDGPRQGLERRPSGPKHEEHRRPDTNVKDPEAPEAIATSCDPEAPAAEEPVAAVTPSLFALQLASPLPPAAPEAPVTPVPVAATPAAPEATPVLPILSSIVPASVVTTPAVTGEVLPVAPAAPVAPTAAVAASVLAEVAPEVLPAEGEPELPEHLFKPAGAQVAPAPAPALDAATAGQPQTGAESRSDGQPDTPAQAQPQAPAAATPAPAAAAAPKADAPVEPTTSAAQPAAPAPTSAPVAPAATGLPRVERAVPLSRAVPTTGVLIHLASERGISHARLNLKPVELGGIEVKLHSTPAGIHAQLIADSPEAARMLSQAGDDLRRQLEDRDVNLLSLDVSTSGDQRGDQPRFSTDGSGDDHRPGGYPSASREDAVLMESPLAADTVLVLPDGVHVDVLA